MVSLPPTGVFIYTRSSVTSFRVNERRMPSKTLRREKDQRKGRPSRMRQSSWALRRSILAACVGGLLALGLAPAAAGAREKAQPSEPTPPAPVAPAPVSAAPPAAQPAPPPAPTVPAAATAKAPPPSTEGQGRGLVVTGIALEIVGAAALVTGGVFSYLVSKTSDDANNLTSGGKVAQGTDLRTKQADGNRFVTMQYVFYAIGGVAAATGIALHIIGSGKNSESATAEIQPAISPTAWGLNLSVRL